MGGRMTYTDVLYDKQDGVAWITINRPEVRNAFRTRTVHELTDAFVDARWDPAIGVVVLTGAGGAARAGSRGGGRAAAGGEGASCSRGGGKKRGGGGAGAIPPMVTGRC